MTIIQIIKALKILKVLGNSGNGNRAIEILHEKIAKNFFFENLFNIFMFTFKIFSFMHVLICFNLHSSFSWMATLSKLDDTYKYNGSRFNN